MQPELVNHFTFEWSEGYPDSDRMEFFTRSSSMGNKTAILSIIKKHFASKWSEDIEIETRDDIHFSAYGKKEVSRFVSTPTGILLFSIKMQPALKIGKRVFKLEQLPN